MAHDNHIGTYCIVMSGRGPSDKEVDHISNTVRTIKSQHPQLKICACLGLTNDEQAKKLKSAGVTDITTILIQVKITMITL